MKDYRSYNNNNAQEMSLIILEENVVRHVYRANHIIPSTKQVLALKFQIVH